MVMVEPEELISAKLYCASCLLTSLDCCRPKQLLQITVLSL